jgi:hypothetical protein
MNRFVYACGNVTILTQMYVDDEWMPRIQDTVVSVQCPRCGDSHIAKLSECRAYRLHGTPPPIISRAS